MRGRRAGRPSDPPPQEDQAPPPDTRPPKIDGDAARRQRIGAAAKLVATASVDEVSQVAASARVRAGGRRYRFAARPVRAEAPGQELRLTLTTSRATARRLRRMVRGGRRVFAVVTIVAVDDTGNSFALRLPRVRLTR